MMNAHSIPYIFQSNIFIRFFLKNLETHVEDYTQLVDQNIERINFVKEYPSNMNLEEQELIHQF